MTTALPIRFQEMLNLTSLGVQPQFLTFNSLAMESEKFITVREEAAGTVNVVIVDVSTRTPSKRPMSADAVLMNPKSQVLALRARDKQTGKDQLQVFNLEMKSKLKSYVMADQVVFWRWISVNTLALVTATKVYHWSMDDGTSEPVAIFQRHESLASAQIINYRVDPENKWAVLVGIQRTPDGRIGGLMQLYSIEKRQSQAIEGHAAGFTRFTVEGAQKPSTLFVFAARTAAGAKLHIIEVGDAPVFQKKSVDINFPPDAPTDFPVGLQISEKYNIAYVVTQQGFIHLFDIESGACIFRNRISKETIFLSCQQESNGGIIAVARTGQVLSITVDEDNVVPYITNTLSNPELAFRFAARTGCTGAEDVFRAQFARFFQAMQYKEAAKVAGDSPQQFLRTSETIERFKQAPAAAGQPPPILQYFGVLLEQGKLNRTESVELVRYVLGIGRKQLIEKWLQEEKLECSEELGDIIKPQDAMLALSVYLRANAPAKVILCFAESGQYPNIIVYSKKVGYQPDYIYLLNNILRINQAAALEFAQKLLQDESGPLADVKAVVDAFVQRNMVQEATSLLLDVLKPNRPEDADLQTLLLEINLVAAPQVADLILSKEMFSHYDRNRVATLCEKAGLGQRALEHYSDLASIKRVISQQGHMMNIDWLVNYFGTLSVEYTLDCLKDLLQARTRHGLQIAVQVASRYSEQLTPQALIQLFESFNNWEGLFFYLGNIVSTTEDPDIVFKFIVAASKTQPPHSEELKRVCRENNVYDAAKVKDFLMEAKLPDTIPLIIVCDRFDFVEELTHYLFKGNMLNKIEVYVQKVNPLRTPMVVGALLDSDCEESFIKNLIMSVRNMCSVEELVDQVEKRHRLKLLQPWLEARVAEGNQDPAAHNALAKIFVDINHDPEHFLQTNQFYDSLVVGKYCEKVDPHLAYVAYKRGQCDHELVDITNRSALFKQQARYLVERQSAELWAVVLDENNKFRRSVIDQVVSTALPESKNADEVSATVKAFMSAGLPNELIELLEKIVLEQSGFSGNKNLQNLLILTAIKASQEKVMEYINRLDNYDGPDIATIAISAGLFEEAFTIYKKFNQNVPAIQVLLNNLQDLERAYEFAERINEPDVWSNLASAQLEHDQVSEGIESFIKAKDPAQYKAVIYRAESAEKYEDLVRYLQMARQKIKESEIDSELAFALAKVNDLSGVEDFINNPNVANLQAVGDRCFMAGLFEAARILFDFIGNYARLASTYVRLERYQQAVEAARKANKTNTWKEINAACVEAKEFRLAQQCAQQIIIQPDELDELVRFYEVRGYFDEIIAVLEQGLTHERAHTGLFTQLGICYSKYRPAKLMEHLKMFVQRISIPRLIRVCESNMQWAELTFLYKGYGEFDNAALTMIEHPGEAWEDVEFRDVIVKVGNTDIYYKAIKFYMEEQPADKLNQLLSALQSKIDNIRLVQIIRKANNLPLIKPYLKSVQSLNIAQVNEALNELFVEEEDYEALQQSIDTFNQFDNLALARVCEKHELIKFRQIAAYLYKNNKRWSQSVELSKQDKLWQTAMETAAESRDLDVAEGLVRFFVDSDLHECFAACLYTCYDLLRPDVVLELAWRKGIIDFAMPYLVQMLREYVGKVDSVIVAREKEKEERKKKEEAQAAEQAAVESAGYTDMSGMPVDSTMYAPQSMIYPPQSGYIDPLVAQQMAMSGYPPSVVPPMVTPGMPQSGFLPPGF